MIIPPVIRRHPGSATISRLVCDGEVLSAAPVTEPAVIALTNSERFKLHPQKSLISLTGGRQ
jgi:hypothetical protein